MHEMSICSALVKIVEQHAEGRPVETVRVDVGHLTQVVPHTLVYSWEIIVSGTDLEGSVLEINHIPAVIECNECGATTTVEVPVFRCRCGSTETAVVSGEELLVRSLELVGD
jgi:hydrogenase nickel incorporation protein HypA/HybF